MSEATGNAPLGGNTAAALLGFVERLENIETQKKALGDRVKAEMASAKAQGFDPKHIKAVLKRRKLPPKERQETDTVQEIYDTACGIGGATPLHRALSAVLRSGLDDAAIFEALKKIAPAQGEIIIRAGGKAQRIFRDAGGEARIEPWFESRIDTPPVAPSGDGGLTKPDAPAVLPEVDEADAERLGREAYLNNQPITSNPFRYGDPRVGHWDRGYRAQSGSDGMGT